MPIGDLAAPSVGWRREGARVVLASDQSARLSELLADADILATPTNRLAEAPPPGSLALIDRSLNGGFAGGPDGIVLVTDRELFGSVRVRRPRALRRVVPRDLLERLTPGDMVVHVDHGVSRYAGLVRRSAGGDGAEERDFLELHFAGTDQIWVPVEQIERVSRATPVASNPHLSRLGGGEWQRAQTRVRKAVADLAKELLELYSARATAHGHAVRRGHALAAGDGGGVPVRGDARPAARRAGGQGRPGARTRRWTASWSATWATARPRSPSGPPSRPSRRARRSPSWCPRPCSRRSTWRPSASGSRRIP